MAKSPQTEGLSAAIDFIKVSTSLAAGALVFGVGYFSNIAPFSWHARIALAVAIVLFLLSAALGLAASSRIPVLIAMNQPNVQDGLLGLLGIGHQLAFVLGLCFVAVVLQFLSASQPPAEDFAIANAREAVERARLTMPRSRVAKVDVIELVHGVDAGDEKLAVWHVRFLLDTPKKDGAKYVDVFLAASSGKVQSLP